ncbi:MAG: hypothetical protein LC687_07335, partial [Actinobacteria bacterium]|nr:hypothetical protein [Actinomycetota bacterium]
MSNPETRDTMHLYLPDWEDSERRAILSNRRELLTETHQGGGEMDITDLTSRIAGSAERIAAALLLVSDGDATLA